MLLWEKNPQNLGLAEKTPGIKADLSCLPRDLKAVNYVSASVSPDKE